MPTQSKQPPPISGEKGQESATSKPQAVNEVGSTGNLPETAWKSRSVIVMIDLPPRRIAELLAVAASAGTAA
jgi:hypothetical protein